MFLLSIVLSSVLRRFTDSDYTLGIFKLFLSLCKCSHVFIVHETIVDRNTYNLPLWLGVCICTICAIPIFKNTLFGLLLSFHEYSGVQLLNSVSIIASDVHYLSSHMKPLNYRMYI